MKLRIKFSKQDSTKFIGHLDVMRYFQKALRRAHVDIKYSTGYSPHPIMSFAAPLGVGIVSQGEYFDIEVNSITSKEDMINALNEQMSPGFRIIDIILLDDNAPNAMAFVAAAKYCLKFKNSFYSSIDFNEAIDLFNSKDQVLIQKQTKKNIIEIDLKPSIYELTYSDNCLYMLVDASSSGNIKPALVLEALLHFYDQELIDNSFNLERIDVYGYSNDNELCPLNHFGKDF